ncbi:MAG: methyltransferase domain-containing protein [Proteobacteria bacterium]|nr:methyltransferase domain-containing protein [Pseudomonadota bacterium]
MNAIERDLARRGADPSHPSIRDLAAADQLHVGGLESIIAFADWVGLRPGARLLDLGSGLGGPARFLASERGAEVTAVELSPALDAAAAELTARTGLADRVRHRCADIAAFVAEEPFDVVWLEHAEMHVPDKRGLYAAARRALATGGRIVWHDWLAGPKGPPRYPLIWSADGAISFLSDEGRFAADLAATGLEHRRFEPIADATAGWLARSRRAIGAALAKIEAAEAQDTERASRLRALLVETENTLAGVEERRLVPFFAEAVSRD